MVYARVMWILVVAFVLSLNTAPAGAQENKQENKQVFRGPAEVTFGRLTLSLPEGAVSEVRYQPDASRLVVKTRAGEARVSVSARYLILLENMEGTMEVRLPTGRVIVIEPGKSEIVGAALANDPGVIVIRLASEGGFTLLEPGLAREIGTVTGETEGFHIDCPVPCPRPERLPPTETFVSPSRPRR